MTQLTGTQSEVAAYEFTTLTCIPGVIHYNDAKIQLLDLPGIIEGAAQGKGQSQYSHCCLLHLLILMPWCMLKMELTVLTACSAYACFATSSL